jgi:biotin carboxylase
MDIISANIDRIQLPRRVLLLLTARTYRAQAFLQAAEKLGVEVIRATDVPKQLADYWQYPLGLEYSNTEKSVQAIVDYASLNPIGAVLPVDDSGTIIAALASQALGLPHNSPKAAEAARDKYIMRQVLEAGGVQCPKAVLHSFASPFNIDAVELLASTLSYPSVLKPLNLNGSRGVIRVNNPQEFSIAAAKLYRLLHSFYSADDPMHFIVEDYVPGIEVALEGILDGGQLHLLALFDKPDPLDGPYFEETIYVTPSRLPAGIQDTILACTANAAMALGLSEGPVHAELRINDEGPWVIEIAGRSIGGLCANTLTFGIEDSLESMIIRQAFGMEFNKLRRRREASGVMMIPIPEAGLFKSVRGCELASSTPLIVDIEITAKVNNLITPLPDGDSYLGFIFAGGETPEAVEKALREAHSKLTFEISPQLPLISGSP